MLNGYPVFFQAEDGIRYGTVTGVQTCALPIYFSTGPEWNTTPSPVEKSVAVTAKGMWSSSRSEERRVGKECRSRWSWFCQKIKVCTNEQVALRLMTVTM